MPASGTGGRPFASMRRYVLITSQAVLEAGVSDFNNASDCFLSYRQTATARLVSRSASSPAATANGGAYCGQFFDDGRYVFYTSTATNAVGSFIDHNGAAGDAHLFDLIAGSTTLVSTPLFG